MRHENNVGSEVRKGKYRRNVIFIFFISMICTIVGGKRPITNYNNMRYETTQENNMEDIN